MKIVIIGGLSESLLNFRYDLLVSLVDHGHEVIAMAGEKSEQIAGNLANINVSFRSFSIQNSGLNPYKDLKSFLSLYKILYELQPDVVMAYTIKPVVYGTLASWLAGVNHRFVLITGLGYAFQGKNTRRLIHFLVCRLYKIALKKAHKAIFQNPDDENLFRNLHLLPKKTPSCIINGSGIDLIKYSPTHLSMAPSFLLVARLLGDKGIREYVEAARHILSKTPCAVFNLVGWIDANPDSISQHEIDAWVKEGIIQFHGRLNDVRPAIASSNIFVLPSYREGTPRSVLEAMSMGRPIITTDVPGCRETVVNGDNGFLVPMRSATLLATAMQRFIDKPQLILTMGKRSRQIAEIKFDVNQVNTTMLREMGIT